MIGQKTQAWLDEHARTIGGSTAAAACGVARWMTRGGLYDRLRNGAEQEDIMTPDMRRGMLLEPIARMELATDLGVEIKPHDQDDFLYNDEYPWAHVLPDGWLTKDSVELKVPRPTVWQRGYMYGLLDEWQIQSQHTMAVLGTQRTHFAALCPVTVQLLYVPIERDDAFIARIMDNERMIWECVQHGKRPVDSEAPKPLNMPKVTGAMLILDEPGHRRAARAHLEAIEIEAEAKELKEQSKAAMIAEAGEDCESWEVPGLLRCYHKWQKGGKQFDHTAALSAYPELARFWTTKKASRPFLAYPLNKRR